MPGRAGYNIGHKRFENGATADNNLDKLRSLIGDDAALYEPFYAGQSADLSKISSLGMWATWHQKAVGCISNFASEAVYVTQNSYSEERFCEVAKEVAAFGPVDLGGKSRDAEFGARVVNTVLGGVTRMWLDGNVEIEFIRRNMPGFLQGASVLDIGAGYGRLAVMMRPFVKEYACVDPVKVSTAICRAYTARFAPTVKTLNLDEFVNGSEFYNLAINIHCWNESRSSKLTHGFRPSRRGRFLICSPLTTGAVMARIWLGIIPARSGLSLRNITSWSLRKRWRLREMLMRFGG